MCIELIHKFSSRHTPDKQLLSRQTILWTNNSCIDKQYFRQTTLVQTTILQTNNSCLDKQYSRQTIPVQTNNTPDKQLLSRQIILQTNNSCLHKQYSRQTTPVLTKTVLKQLIKSFLKLVLVKFNFTIIFTIQILLENL